MKKIVYTRPDGGVSVVHPAEGARLARWIKLADGTILPEDANTTAIKDSPPRPADSILRRWPVEGAVAKWAESETEFYARIAAKDVPPDAINVRVVDEGAFPSDRSFRNAWTDAYPTKTIDVDMDKARDIHRDNLRALRTPLLAKLDVEAIRADEIGDAAKKAEVVAAKQALRDITTHPEIDAAESPDDLKLAALAALSEL